MLIVTFRKTLVSQKYALAHMGLDIIPVGGMSIKANKCYFSNTQFAPSKEIWDWIKSMKCEWFCQGECWSPVGEKNKANAIRYKYINSKKNYNDTHTEKTYEYTKTIQIWMIFKGERWSPVGKKLFGRDQRERRGNAQYYY